MRKEKAKLQEKTKEQARRRGEKREQLDRDEDLLSKAFLPLGQKRTEQQQKEAVVSSSMLMETDEHGRRQRLSRFLSLVKKFNR